VFSSASPILRASSKTFAVRFQDPQPLSVGFSDLLDARVLRAISRSCRRFSSVLAAPSPGQDRLRLLLLPMTSRGRLSVEVGGQREGEVLAWGPGCSGWRRGPCLPRTSSLGLLDAAVAGPDWPYSQGWQAGEMRGWRSSRPWSKMTMMPVSHGLCDESASDEVRVGLEHGGGMLGGGVGDGARGMTGARLFAERACERSERSRPWRPLCLSAARDDWPAPAMRSA
jgi:hypothetical protein